MKLFLAFALAILLTPSAQAKNGFYPTRFYQANHGTDLMKFGPLAAGKLQYYGGPVISSANVLAVFWGNNVVSDIKSGIGEFYNALTRSDLMTWMDQYNTTGKSLDGRDGTNQRIGKGSYLGAVTISPAKTKIGRAHV